MLLSVVECRFANGKQFRENEPIIADQGDHFCGVQGFCILRRLGQGTFSGKTIKFLMKIPGDDVT